jgi:acyl-CoA hydrolase
VRGVVYHRTAEACVDAILAQVGKTIVLGLPLGLGKANHIANALYRRAAADPSIRLKIFTALTLEKTAQGPKLLQRFAGPIAERLFGAYPDLLYAAAARAGTLPANIEVMEFYLLAGQWLHVAAAQHSYISANYTEAARLLIDRGVNVIAQLVAKGATKSGPAFSLSCNTDVTLDLLDEIEKRRRHGPPIVVAAEVNDELPFMTGVAALPADQFDHVLDSPETRFALMAPPKEPVSLGHHAIGLHIAGLVKDGGTLQLGIGALADAVAWALILRHTRNQMFRQLAGQLGHFGDGERDTFSEGLYGVSEMFADVFLDLYRAGILKRRAPDGTLLHAAFFVGPGNFYRALREMPESERDKFRMMPISFTNDIGGPGEQEKRAMRRDARFVNTAMMASLLGEVASDTRDDGQVVSGVGGQYNFVAQAHALDGARSIIALNATRMAGGRLSSNIRMSCSHVTIPRHLRDIVVTEFGVADLRGKSDRDCIVAMLNIAHSQFQPSLLQQAKRAGKIEPGYEISGSFLQNTEQALIINLAPAAHRGDLPEYPFGTDLDPMEQHLVAALERLKSHGGKMYILRALLRSFVPRPRMRSVEAGLQRLGLASPLSVDDRVLRRILMMELEQAVSHPRNGRMTK